RHSPEVCGGADCAAEGSAVDGGEASRRADDRGAEGCEDGEQSSADWRCEFASGGDVDGEWVRDRLGAGQWLWAWTGVGREYGWWAEADWRRRFCTGVD